MSRVVSKNYTDTPISGVTTLTLPRGKVNYGADFRVKSEEPNEVLLTNMTSPIGFPENFRIGISEVANVYKGSNIDPAFCPPSKKGLSLLVQLTEMWKVTDTTDPSYEVCLPVSAHIVIKVPNNEAILASDVNALIGRLISGAFETGSENNDRLQAMLRGSLLPKDL